MRKVVLDMDPGIDDALALILALKSPEIEVLGITTVAGNAPVETTTANARRLLEYLGASDVPVAAGAAKPLRHALVDALDYHGSDGLGECGLPSPRLGPHPAKAWDFLADLALNAPGQITIVATAPLTNVALALEAHPELARLLSSLVVMGGAYGLTPYGKGNRTPFAEFNIWQDPEAASIVLGSGAEIVAVGLDVSKDPATYLTGEHLARLRKSHTPSAHLAARLAEYLVKRKGCCELHDPLALASVLQLSLFHFISAPVKVVTGNGSYRGVTRVLPLEKQAQKPLIRIAAGVDGPGFLRLLLSRILEE